MNLLKRVSVIGHFGKGKCLLNGQTVKTIIITDELCRQLGSKEIIRIDTYGGKSTVFKAPFQTIKALKNSKNVIIFPAHNGLKVYVPLLSFFRKFYKDRKLHYVVIGGWLSEFLKNKKRLTKKLMLFDGIYVETNTMKKSLEEQGFNNVVVMPNCKDLKILSQEDLVYPVREPYKLCTFSRVMKEKGIEDAINAVKTVNESTGKTIYSLDIYGQVDSEQIQWFEDLKSAFPDYIKYGGLVDYNNSVEVLKNYFILLFPTRFYTEGIPGTIIDAYAAGVPVVSAKWESFTDIIIDGVTGIGYEFLNQNQLIEVLRNIQIEKILKMKTECLSQSRKYMPEIIIKTIIRQLKN